MLKFFSLFFITFSCVSSFTLENNLKYILSDEYIDRINNIQTTWKAGRNFAPDTPIEHIRGLMGTFLNVTEELTARLPTVKHDDMKDEIPEQFDAREQWPKCESIKHIRDQGACGSCWAVAAVGAMSDRVCIASDQKLQVQISAEDLLSCCGSCGYGCEGGYPIMAWEYWRLLGIVSGGDYKDEKTCRPYTIEPCEHHGTGKYKKCGNLVPTPTCVHKCQPKFDGTYKKDLYRAKTAYNVHANVKDIQKEIMKNGPVEAAFTVFSDFVTYKSGVYQPTSTWVIGGHAIKILGWGVEDGTPYWLCANSWNEDWGDKGYFKIIRGHNNGGMERAVVAGLPKL